MLARMIERQPGVWPDNVLGKWGSKNFRKKEMEDALKNNVYGFSTTNPLPKAIANTGDTGKSSKTRGKRVVHLQKELDVQQAIKNGTVKPSALADELKLRGVSTAISTPVCACIHSSRKPFKLIVFSKAIAKAATSSSVIVRIHPIISLKFSRMLANIKAPANTVPGIIQLTESSVMSVNTPLTAQTDAVSSSFPKSSVNWMVAMVSIYHVKILLIFTFDSRG
jgi:hypothetical protein